MTTVDRGPVTDWLIALLEGTDDGEGGGYPVGDHSVPAGAGFPFWVVRSIPGGSVSGPPLTAPDADAELVYQVDSVGRTRGQAEALADRARRRILGRGPGGGFLAAAETQGGAAVRDRIPDGPPGASEVSGDRPNEIYTVADRYRLAVSAAGQ